jgi:DNA-binding XRE family transcriptional regulator
VVLEVGGSIPLAHPASRRSISLNCMAPGSRPAQSAPWPATRSDAGRAIPSSCSARALRALSVSKYLFLFDFSFKDASVPQSVGPDTRADTRAFGRYDSGVNAPPEPPTVNRIRAARQALGWTQNELANKAGVSARTIHAIEKGRSCRQATKRSILNALGVPWDLRDEYFQRALSVRRVRAIDTAHSA